MFKKSAAVLGMVLILFAVVTPANAQTCNGTNSCTVTATASVAVPALVDLELSSIALTLTPPAVADLATGYVDDAGPTITVKANRTWTLSIHTTNPLNWTYVGDQGGVKPIGDFTWSNTNGAGYAAITTAPVAIVSAQAKTNAGAPTVFFRTVYDASFAANNNSAGTYSLPVVFTLSAP